ncbi:hypothetical protein [Streptomyces sp. NPDC093544]
MRESRHARILTTPILAGAALDALTRERRSSREISTAVALVVAFPVAATG